MTERLIPRPDALTSLRALRAMRAEGSVLAAFESFHQQLGSVFRLQLPGFHPVVLVGPEANEFVLVKAREQLRWRSDSDPIAQLLGNGLLVSDGPALHDAPRHVMTPALHLPVIHTYLRAMIAATERTVAGWRDGDTVDIVAEMRRLSLRVVYDALFCSDIEPELDALWPSILRLMDFISPGLWMMWAGAPRPGYGQAREEVDRNLYAIIARRRAASDSGSDLLSLLMRAGYDDGMIRDELMTMVVAGHDTTTALLAWFWTLLGQHDDIQRAMQAEVDAEPTLSIGDPYALTLESLDRLPLLSAGIKEALRLYPPAHLGSRIALEDLDFNGYPIPAGSRVIYSIYLTHRMAEYWPQPERFWPERWVDFRPLKFTYLPFGGGPRICIGAAFGEIQARVVAALILKRFSLSLLPGRVSVHMGATIEPRQGRHGARMRVSTRLK